MSVCAAKIVVPFLKISAAFGLEFENPKEKGFEPKSGNRPEAPSYH